MRAFSQPESDPDCSGCCLLATRIRIWWARLRGQVSFETHRRYVVLSLLRLDVNWLTISIAIVIGVNFFNTTERARRLLELFEAPSIREFHELWAITTAPTSLISEVGSNYSLPRKTEPIT